MVNRLNPRSDLLNKLDELVSSSDPEFHEQYAIYREMLKLSISIMSTAQLSGFRDHLIEHLDPASKYPKYGLTFEMDKLEKFRNETSAFTCLSH
jgi:hypothetical protein